MSRAPCLSAGQQPRPGQLPASSRTPKQAATAAASTAAATALASPAVVVAYAVGAPTATKRAVALHLGYPWHWQTPVCLGQQARLCRACLDPPMALPVRRQGWGGGAALGVVNAAALLQGRCGCQVILAPAAGVPRPLCYAQQQVRCVVRITSDDRCVHGCGGDARSSHLHYTASSKCLL